MPEHIGCVLAHQALRGVWDAVDQGESGTLVSEQKWDYNGRELCILVQHLKGLKIYLLLYTVTNSRCWGCICSIFMGDIWQDVFIWLQSSLDSLILRDRISDGRLLKGHIYDDISHLHHFCQLYLLCDICLHWQFCCETLPLCYFTMPPWWIFVSPSFSDLFLPLPNCRNTSRVSILFSDIIDCVYFFHLHALIYMIKSSESLFLVVEYNIHYQLSIKVKGHYNYYDSVSCSHLYLLLSTYH